VRTCYTMKSRRHESSSSSRSIIFFFRDEELGWMDDGTDGWKGRRPPGQNQGYYISRQAFHPCMFRFFDVVPIKSRF
jgi:hypothetical protein